MGVRSAWALLCVVTGCSCEAEPGDSAGCTTATECPSGSVCVDGTCTPSTLTDGGGNDTGAGFDGTMPGIDGSEFGTDTSMSPDTTCGSAIPIDLNPPNVLLVFDRSCSMRRRFVETEVFGSGPEDPGTRWYVAREAVRRLTLRYPGRVRWGLMAFPDPREGCGMPTTTEVPPAPMTADTIYATLMTDDIQPFGLCGLDNSDSTTQPRDTPTQDALEEVLLLPDLMDATRESFAVLLTDGGASCGATPASLMDVTSRLRAAGIDTAVIGFTVGADESTLEAIAASGGLPRPGGPPSFYAADDAADLDAALDAIVLPTIPCTFALDDVPPDSETLRVGLNDVEAMEDGTNGWTYDAGTNEVTLHGEACTRLRNGDITRISVAFGCGQLACAPRPEECNGLDEDCDDRVDEDCLL